MKLEKRVKERLIDRGFSKEWILNNRGLVSAIIEETELAITIKSIIDNLKKIRL